MSLIHVGFFYLILELKFLFKTLYSQNYISKMSDSQEKSVPSDVPVESAAQQQPSSAPAKIEKHSNADETNGIGISKSYLKSLSGILRILIIVNKNLMYLNKVRL